LVPFYFIYSVLLYYSSDRDHEVNRTSLLSTDMPTEEEDLDDFDANDWNTPRSNAAVAREEQRLDLSRRKCSDDDADDSDHQVMKCVLCARQPLRYILYPCGHPCLCEDCVKEKLSSLHNVCPVGGCKFQDAIRVHGKIVGG